LICLLLFCSSFIKSQTDITKQLLGTWYFVSEEKIILGEDIVRIDSLSKNTTPDNFFQKGIEMSFQDATNLAFKVSHEGMSLVVPYTSKDSVFTIINRSYQILKIDTQELLFTVKTDSIRSKYTYKKY